MHATLRIATGLLTAAACCAAVRVTPSGDNWIVENDRLRVTLRNAAGTISVLDRSEEHTSELQSLRHLVCRRLLEKKTDTCWTSASPRPCLEPPTPPSNALIS